MPYSKLSDAPASLRGIKPAITLAQANEITHCADALISDNVKSPFAVCVEQFKTKAYRVEDGRWVRRGQKGKEYFEIAIAPRATEADAGFAGREWDVTIIGADPPGSVIVLDGREYVRSKNGRLYDCEALRESAPLWDGVKVYDNHLTDAEFQQRQGMRSVGGEWIGTLVNPHWDTEKRQLRSMFKVVEESIARKLKAAWDQKVLGTIGLSIDTLTDGREAVIEGQTVSVVEGFKKIFSVDLVAEPAAGGGFNRLIAAQQTVREVHKMTDEELRAMVSAAIADTLPGAVVEALAANETQESEETADEEVGEVETEATEEASESEEEATEEVQAEETESETSSAGGQALETVRRLECKILLRDKLDAANLPDELRRVAEAQFLGKVFEEVDLDSTIKRLKEAYTALDQSGQVRGVGGQRAVLTPGMDGRDVAEVEFLRLIAGNTAFRALEHAKTDFVQERITEAYEAWVKTGRPKYGTRRISEWLYQLLDGDPLADQRAYEAVTTSSMSSIVKNTVNLLLAADYAKRTRWWEPIVTTEEVDTIDDATLVRVYGLDTLSEVSEGGPYTELGWVDEEETAAFVKRGNFVGVTLETILRDRVQVIRTIPRRLSTSWYNTISALVSAVFTTNTATGPVLSDTGAMFNATAVTTAGGHANLLTAALGFTSYGAARTAMMKQTDQYSGGESNVQGQRLLIQPKSMLVSVDGEAMGNRIRNSEMMPGSQDNDVNPYYQQFEVIPVPNWTDVDDWALVGDKNEFPAIWLIFLRGRQVPELFTADSEAGGSMFTNDTLRYKVRMLTYRFSSTYDCAPVSDFRALHKSNVA